MTTPAMRIRVRDLRLRHQHTTGSQQIDDGFVGFEYRLSLVLGQTAMKTSSSIDVARWIQSILHAGVEVIGTMRRSGVHRSGALLQCYVICEHAENLPIQEGMVERGSLEFASGEARYHLCIC